MEIQLGKSVKIILQKEENKTISSVILSHVEDDFTKVTAYFKYDGLNRITPLVLWEGLDYETIGQWTDADVEIRIKQLIK